jgi:RND family efflux transporter MFP subunit
MIYTIQSLCLALLLTGFTFGFSGCKKAPSTPTALAVPVIAAEVLVRDTTNYVENIGQTFGAQDVEIRARVAGFLESMSFSEGKPVRSNDLLYVIDPKPFQATLAQAKGVLDQATVNWEKTRLDTNRIGQLWAGQMTSRQDYDNAITAEQSAVANVKAAQAAVETAEIQLGYTRIYSPIDGIAGKSEVSVGNLVGQGQNTLLTTISDLSSIIVRFSVSEQDYLVWKRKHPEPAFAKGVFELILADGVAHPYRNSDAFADRQVDPQTGTLMLQVTFPNPSHLVRPGQFARVRFPVEVIPGAILVPQRAVQEMQAVFSVFVVAADGKAEFRKITPGPRIGDFFVVREGLKPGEIIVIEGIQKLQNGVPVAVTLTNLVPLAVPAH